MPTHSTAVTPRLKDENVAAMLLAALKDLKTVVDQLEGVEMPYPTAKALSKAALLAATAITFAEGG